MLPQRYIYVIFTIAFLSFGASAHPLGNFSVNQYSHLEVGSSSIKIRQVLDIAEIPTFQLKTEIDTNTDGTLSQAELDAYAERLTPLIISNLRLLQNGEVLNIRNDARSIELRPGAGGLQTLRLSLDLSAALKPADSIEKVSFENNNYPERVGWREIVVGRTNGIEVFDSTAFGTGLTDELRAYPQETLASPLNERAAGFSFTHGALPPGAVTLKGRDGLTTSPVQKDRLAELIAVPQLTPAIVTIGLLLALGLGAIHAMSPGHGKTIVGAYLVGSKGTPKHAVFLGLAVTITHTLGVFALGLLTLFASNFILPETLMPFLSFLSGLIVLYIGLTMFKTRLFSVLGLTEHSHDHTHGHHEEDGHTHEHGTHTHTHDGHTHAHTVPDKISWRGLLALGVSGGLLPCPSALVLMLSAISLGRVGYGMILTVAFSLGLALTLTGVGLAFLYLGKVFDGPKLSRNWIIRSLPVASALIIACVGAVICYTSVP